MDAWVEHGINVFDGGRGSVDRVQPLLRRMGWTVREMDYGWTGVLGAWFWNDNRARELARQVTEPSLGIGHSNGCTLLHEACAAGAPFSHLLYIAPALDADLAPPPGVRRLDVFFARDDLATWASRWLPWSSWGDMGMRGYRGPRDKRVRNWDLFEFLAPPIGHSGMFSKRLFQQFEAVLAKALREEDR